MFWNYGMQWVCETMNRTYMQGHPIDGGVPPQKVTEETVNISEYLDHGFYNHVKYHDNAGLGVEKIRRWLGHSQHVGGLLCSYVMQANGEPVSRSLVHRITELEMREPTIKDNIKAFNKLLDKYLGKRKFPASDGDKPNPEDWADLISTDEDFKEAFFKDLYMEIALPRGDYGDMFATVKNEPRVMTVTQME